MVSEIYYDNKSKKSNSINPMIEINNQLPINKPVNGHFTTVPFLLTSEMFEGLDFEMVSKEISLIVGQSVSDLHVHEYPEIYVLISTENGGAEIEVETTTGKYKMTSPAVAYIPAHTEHRFIVLKAIPGSFCLGILLNKKIHDRSNTNGY